MTDKSWLKAVPARIGDGEDEVPEIAGRIPHFLLPAEGWGAASEVGKDIKELAPEAVRALKDWRRQVRAKPARKQVDQLVDMGQRVQRLWEIATHRLTIADAQIRREIPVWGRPDASALPGVGDGRAARDPRGDRGVARRPGRRLPAAAPDHGRLVRAVVLAADRGRQSSRRRWSSGRRRWR